jgi:hypothetical protein
MEELTIPLSQKFTFGTRLFINTQVACAVIFIAQGVAHPDSSLWFSWFAMVYGIGLLFTMTVLPRLHKDYSVKIDDAGIRGRLGYSRRIDLPWGDLAHADIKMFALILTTKRGETVHIGLDDLTYDQHKLVKPRLLEILGAKGLLKHSS